MSLDYIIFARGIPTDIILNKYLHWSIELMDMT